MQSVLALQVHTASPECAWCNIVPITYIDANVLSAASIYY